MSDQCDTANSVAQFLTHFIEDRGRQDQGLLYPYQQNPEEQVTYQCFCYCVIVFCVSVMTISSSVCKYGRHLRS